MREWGSEGVAEWFLIEMFCEPHTLTTVTRTVTHTVTRSGAACSEESEEQEEEEL